LSSDLVKMAGYCDIYLVVYVYDILVTYCWFMDLWIIVNTY